MTLQQLEYIIAVDDFKHFVTAANACRVTQSTLSLMVKKLEEELDVRIFDRNSHPVAPTEIGRKIIGKARVVIYNARQLVEMTQSEKDLVSGPLRLAMISTTAPVLMPGMFKYLKTNYPDIAMKAEEMITETIKYKLKKAEIDMGIVTSPVRDPDLLEIPLYHERFLAYVSPEEDGENDVIENDDIFRRPVWIMKDGVHLADISELNGQEDVAYEKMYEGGRVGTLIQIVNENGGMTLIPETHSGLIFSDQRKHLKPIVNPAPGRVISLAVRKDYIHEAMLNVVIKAVKSILPDDRLEEMARKDYLFL